MPSGGLIDRRQPLRFQFDGKAYAGYAGDTLASALLAAGVKLVGRSFKYHRPRGILTAGSEEPNALVELRTGARREPNTRATTTELFDGLEAHSQNRWPSLAFDVGAVNSLLAPLFVAGFYYKTFMWPAALLGEALRAADPPRRGPRARERRARSGHLREGARVLRRAGHRRRARGPCRGADRGRAGARVILCDEDFVLGGRLNAERREIDGMSGIGVGAAGRGRARCAAAKCASCAARACSASMTAAPSVRSSVCRITLPVPAAHQPRQRLWKIVAQTDGARRRRDRAADRVRRQRPAGRDDGLGGAHLSESLSAWPPGERVVLFTTTDDGWKTALDLARRGRRDRGDRRCASRDRAALLADSEAPRCARAARVRKSSMRVGVTRSNARHVRDARASASQLAPICSRCRAAGTRRRACPRISAGGRAGSRPSPPSCPARRCRGMAVVGRGARLVRPRRRAARRSGGGREAAQSTGLPRCHRRAVHARRRRATGVDGVLARGRVQRARPSSISSTTSPSRTSRSPRAKAFSSVEHLKRYTTLGMGTDQGKTSNVNGLAILAALTGRAIPEVGTTVFRPPYTPVAIGAFAGPPSRQALQADAPDRRATTGPRSRARRSSRPASGCVRSGSPQPVRTDWLRDASRAK